MLQYFFSIQSVPVDGHIWKKYGIFCLIISALLKSQRTCPTTEKILATAMICRSQSPERNLALILFILRNCCFQHQFSCFDIKSHTTLPVNWAPTTTNKSIKHSKPKWFPCILAEFSPEGGLASSLQNRPIKYIWNLKKRPWLLVFSNQVLDENFNETY